MVVFPGNQNASFSFSIDREVHVRELRIERVRARQDTESKTAYFGCDVVQQILETFCSCTRIDTVVGIFDGSRPVFYPHYINVREERDL
jgi:hypothetical protein